MCGHVAVKFDAILSPLSTVTVVRLRFPEGHSLRGSVTSVYRRRLEAASACEAAQSLPQSLTEDVKHELLTMSQLIRNS